MSRIKKYLVIVSSLAITHFGCSKDPINPLGTPSENNSEATTVTYNVNLAFEGKVTASSFGEGESGNSFNLTDGTKSVLNHSFGLHQTTTNEEGWFKIKLIRKQLVNEVVMYPKLGGGGIEGYPEGFKIQTSIDDENWETVVEKDGVGLPSNVKGEKYSFNKKEAEYIRVYVLKRRHIENMWTPPGGIYDAQLAEIEVYLRQE